MWNRKADMMKKNIVFAAMLICVICAGCANQSEDTTQNPDADVVEADADFNSSDSEYETDEQVSISDVGAKKPLEKEETVSVKASADGSPESVKVSVTLKRDGDAVILDNTNLTDIKNKEGDEEFELRDDGTLLFENHGEDISYEGDSSDLIPITVKVRYYLDGKELNANDIAGKSGDVVIRFEYKNNTSVPFTVISAVMLSDEHFSDIKVENGQLMSIGDTQVAVGYAIPGLYDALLLGDYEDLADTELPEYVEITAKAEDFRIDYTATVVSNGSFSDMEDEDIDDLTELSDNMKDLGKASGKISDALSKLSGGGSEFGEYLSSYTTGVDSLYGGLNALNANLAAFDTTQLAALEAMNPALAGLSSNIEQLKGSVAALNDGAAQLSVSGAQLNTAYGELLNGINTLSSNYVKFNKDGIKKISDAGGDDMGEILDRVKALREADSSYNNFSGITDGTKGSVRFIIETAEIK